MHAEPSRAVTAPQRRELPAAQCWDLESIFATPQDFDERAAAITTRLPELAAFRGQLGTSAATLLAGLTLRDELLAELDRLRTYGVLRMSEDASDSAKVDLRDRALALQARGRAAAAFFEPELLAIDPATLERYCQEERDLDVYRHSFATLRQRAANVRSPEIEALLAAAATPLGTFEWTYQALVTNDLRFGSIRDTAGQTIELQQHNRFHYLHRQDRAVREVAWKAYADAYLALRHTLASNLGGVVATHVFLAQARGYPSAADAALAQQGIPRAILDTTIETVWRHFPVWQRYCRVRARLLGVELAHDWDISEMPIPRPDRAPLPFIPYEDGFALVQRALAPLGDEYAGVLQRARAERWIDPLPNVGKVSGAFSSGSYLTHPFLCLNWAGDLAAVSVLAHELGHSIHSYYSWTHQPYVYGYYSDFVAEAVSNLHQFLLADYLLATVDDPDILVSVIEERMGYSLRYLFTMPLLARFELDAHARVERGEALTAESMLTAMADLYRQGYGEAVVLDPERMGITWATFGHLYGDFYIYQYATGMAAAAALARQIREEGPPAIERLLTLLRAGASADPNEILAAAGVDMRTPAPLEAAFELLSSYIDRLEQLI
jgi:oligoendopeptidase F